MALKAISFGNTLSKPERSSAGPSTQPLVANRNGASTFASAAAAIRTSSMVTFICPAVLPPQVQPSGVQSQ